MRMWKLLGVVALALVFVAGCGGRSNKKDGGTDGGTDGDGGSGQDTTIYAIQDVDNADHPDLGAAVVVEDVVVTTPMIFTTADSPVPDGFYVAEPEGGAFSGIYVYAQGLNISVAPGDTVNLRGIYEEYFDASQIIATQVDVLGTGDIPDPVVVTPAQVRTQGPDAETYEGVLIQVENVTITADDLGYGDFGVSSQAGGDELIVSPDFDTHYTFEPVLNMEFSSLTGVLGYNYDEHRLLPRFCADFVEANGADVCEDKICPAGAVEIEQIQNRDAEDAVGENCPVTVEGVIVTSPKLEDGFWVGEPAGGAWSGIYVYSGRLDTQPEVQMGDQVDLTGEYAEYYENSQLVASTVTVVGPASLPPATVVTTDQVNTTGAEAEMYEGVVVQLSGVTIANANAGFGNFTIQPSGGGAELLVAPEFDFNYEFTPVAGFEFQTITGILNYDFDEFRLNPRACADLLDAGGQEACRELTCPDGPVTMAQIQDRSHAQAIPAESCEFTIEGVVVTSPVIDVSGRPSFYVQEPAGGQWSGAFVWGDAMDATGIDQGTVLDITGTFTEYFGMTQIVPTAWTNQGSAALPAPAVVAAADINNDGALAEAYEGVLVEVQGVMTTQAVFPGGNGQDFGDFLVAPLDAQDAELVVGWQFEHDFACPGYDGPPCQGDQRQQGQVFDSIVGPLNYSFDNFRIMPRSVDDITVRPADPADPDQDGYCTPGEQGDCVGEDNCPDTFNDDQADGDADGVGDVCDSCPADADPGQEDGDTDGIGDVCDNCPAVANPAQADMDTDEIGDACDPDIDGDGIDQGDGSNPCTGGAVADCDDNCPLVDNADQADEDSDGVGDVCEAGEGHLLLTEVCVQPGGHEFVEIHNPTAAAIDLTDYYLWDATAADIYYWLLATAPVIGQYDFAIRFPAGATIDPGAYQTVTISAAADFETNFGVAADYAALGDGSGATANMLPAYANSIGGSAGLSNGGEVLVLFTWDGSSDLVQDVDYLLWGDGAEASDKTGVTVGGSTYLPDTPVGQQDAQPGHDNEQSMQRVDLTEGNEVKTGGNGISGHDETSEDVSATWTVGPFTPGQPAQ